MPLSRGLQVQMSLCLTRLISRDQLSHRFNHHSFLIPQVYLTIYSFDCYKYVSSLLSIHWICRLRMLFEQLRGHATGLQPQQPTLKLLDLLGYIYIYHNISEAAYLLPSLISLLVRFVYLNKRDIGFETKTKHCGRIEVEDFCLCVYLQKTRWCV